MADIILKSFPSSTPEFLASLWLQQQDLKGKSPVEISDLYDNALSEINAKYHKTNHSQGVTSVTHRRKRSNGIVI